MGIFDLFRKRSDPIPTARSSDPAPGRDEAVTGPAGATPVDAVARAVRDAKRNDSTAWHQSQPRTDALESDRKRGVEESVYLHSSRWDELLVPGVDGMPPLRFKLHNNRLWFAEDTTRKLVKVQNRKLRQLGVWTVKVRGYNYYPEAVAATRMRLFEPVALIRERDNEHDRNAVAIHSSAGKIGYFNKQMAAGISKRLDAGDELVAFITSVDTPPNVVAASPTIMAHLRRQY